MQGHLDVVPVYAQLRADVLRAAQALSGTFGLVSVGYMTRTWSH